MRRRVGGRDRKTPRSCEAELGYLITADSRTLFIPRIGARG